MKKLILLGVDTNLSPPTHYALRTLGAFFERTSPPVYVVLLNVIPLGQMSPLHTGIYSGHVLPVTTSSWQHTQANEVLHKARAVLQQLGFDREYIEEVVRIGAPADEIASVASELHANFIVIGSRGAAFKQRLRRFLIGSISRRVLELAPCPVMVVSRPQMRYPSDLVAWYEKAVTRYLQEHAASLTVFTPEQVARQFAPPDKKTPEHKEIAAANLALEKLAADGILFRHDVKGKLRYVND